MPKPLNRIQYFKNNGGWNTMANELDFPENSSPDMMDCRLSVNGKLIKMLGDNYLGSQHGDGAVGWRCIHQFQQADGTLKNVAITSTDIASLNLTTGALTNLNTNLTDNDDRLYHTCQHDHRGVYCDINENVLTWDGTDAVAPIIQDITNATALTGTVTFAASTAVIGAGTAFSTEISIGDWISIDGVLGNAWGEVATITTDTALVLKETWAGATGAGGAGASEVSANFGKAKYCASFNNMLILAHVNRGTLSKNTFWYSNIDQEYYFPNVVGKIFFETIKECSEIQGVFVLGDFLYVITDIGVRKYTFTGDASAPLLGDWLDGGGGFSSGYSVQKIYSNAFNRELVIWANSEGFKVLHDDIIETITENNIKDQFNKLNFSRIDSITSYKNSEFHEIVFNVSTGSSSTHDTKWIWDYVNNIFYPATGGDNVGFEMNFGADGLIPLTGDYNGYLRKQNDTGYDLQERNLDWSYTTAWLNMERSDIYKNFRKIIMYAKSNNSATLKLYYRLGGDNGFASAWESLTDISLDSGAVKWDEPGVAWDDGTKWGAGAVMLKKKRGIGDDSANFIQFKFENTELGKDIEVMGWEVYLKMQAGSRGDI